MPNGGSDCCGTCWFNKSNRGERGYPSAHSPEPAQCTIRDVPIEDPFYTYCANHPHRRPDRDPIPIGPIMVNISGGQTNDRVAWRPSPDSEEIRRHLLDLLDDIFTHIAQDPYPIGTPVASAVIRQLGDFRERRAVETLQRLRDSDYVLGDDAQTVLGNDARIALEKIGKTDS